MKQQLGHTFTLGSVAVDGDVASWDLDFAGPSAELELGLRGVSGVPSILTIALSVMTVWCNTGIVTGALQTGHFPVFPGLDSLAVK